MKNEEFCAKLKSPGGKKDFMEVSSLQQTKGKRAQNSTKSVCKGNGLVLWALQKSGIFLRRNSI